MHHFIPWRIAVIISRYTSPKSICALYLKALNTDSVDRKKEKKGDISEASTWHGVNLDATSHTSHPPTILPTRELTLQGKFSASSSWHSFIHPWYHQSSFETAVILFKYQLCYRVINYKLCDSSLRAFVYLCWNPRNEVCRLFWMGLSLTY